MRRARALVLIATAGAALLGGCGDDRAPWESGDADATKPVSVAPAATSVEGEPPAATTPGDAASPAGTTPDGGTIGDEPAGTSAPTPPADGPSSAAQALRQDKAAMLDIRTAMSTIEGCHSGRPSYVQCDEQSELGSRKELGITFGDGPGEIKVSASPQSVRVTVRSESGARFTVARSPKGDRFSCQSGPVPGACPEQGTWSW